MAPTNQPSTLIARSHLGSDVYRVLWERLLDRQFHAGEKLSDQRLSTEFGVSRTPVREALHRLAQDGVVHARPNRGFFVASFSPVDIAEIYDLRAALEGFALRTVTPAIASTDLQNALDELDEAAALIASATSAGERFAAAAHFLELDRGFHRCLIERTGNGRLLTIIHGLWAQIAVFQRAGAHVPGWMEVAIAQHRDVINLLLTGDVLAAAAALEAHILDMKARVLAELAPTFEEKELGTSIGAKPEAEGSG